MNYHNILTDNMVNGEGLRTVLWVSGCGHFCPNCFNPQTWDKNSGIYFDEKSKQELFYYLSKPYIDGITLSGGDPLNEYNLTEINKLIDEIKIKFPTKTIWIYSGYTYEELDEIRRSIVNKCEVLIDGKYIHSLYDPNLLYRGSSNQRVIDLKETINQGKIVLFCA